MIEVGELADHCGQVGRLIFTALDPRLKPTRETAAVIVSRGALLTLDQFDTLRETHDQVGVRLPHTKRSVDDRGYLSEPAS
jgi:hypothetical protein